MPQETRDQVVDTVDEWVGKTEINVGRMIAWLETNPSKYYDWERRHGEESRRNVPVARRVCLAEWGKDAVRAYCAEAVLPTEKGTTCR